MKPEYKFVKEVKPFCTICGEKLTGNGSMMLPYQCLCGIWEWDTKAVELVLKKKKNEKKAMAFFKKK